MCTDPFVLFLRRNEMKNAKQSMKMKLSGMDFTIPRFWNRNAKDKQFTMWIIYDDDTVKLSYDCVLYSRSFVGAFHSAIWREIVISHVVLCNHFPLSYRFTNCQVCEFGFHTFHRTVNYVPFLLFIFTISSKARDLNKNIRLWYQLHSQWPEHFHDSLHWTTYNVYIIATHYTINRLVIALRQIRRKYNNNEWAVINKFRLVWFMTIIWQSNVLSSDQ